MLNICTKCGYVQMELVCLFLPTSSVNNNNNTCDFIYISLSCDYLIWMSPEPKHAWDCKTLSVFERKIPLTLEFRFHQEWRPCIMPGCPPSPISLLNISVYRLQPRLFMDSLPYHKKNQKDHKELQFRS